VKTRVGSAASTRKSANSFRRELDLALAARDVAGDRVDRQLADPEQAARATLARAPEDSADSTGDFAGSGTACPP
jgi:hypothetical protein